MDHYFISYVNAESLLSLSDRSDEMRPQWFASGTDASRSLEEDLPAIPYEQMYQKAKIWIPLVLSGKHVVGRIDFVPNPSIERKYDMRRWWFGEVLSTAP